MSSEDSLSRSTSRSTPAPGTRSGRPRATSAETLEAVALDLFTAKGFNATTVDEIAAASGISQRTFFRYFDSKNDVVWGDFDGHLERLRDQLAAAPTEQPMMDTLRDAVVEFNRVAPEALPAHRKRMTLITTVPALQAHSALRYAAWREVIAQFVASRTSKAPNDFLPQLVASCCLGAAMAAYQQWLSDDDADLLRLLALAMRELAHGFAGHEH